MVKCFHIPAKVAQLVAFLMALLFGPFQVSAASEPACAPQAMQRIVTSLEAEGLSQIDFATKPKTLYRYTEKFGRLEEAPDPQVNLHQLIVVSEPDIWMVNLMDSTGFHMVDPGPDLHFVAPVLQIADLDFWGEFEFGCEVAFMVDAGVDAVPLDPRGRLLYTHREDDIDVKLYVNAEGLPSKVDVELPNDSFSVIYHEYETDLEPDLSLFGKPSTITFEER